MTEITNIASINEAIVYLLDPDFIDLNQKPIREALQRVLARHFNDEAVVDLAKAIANGSRA